MNNPSGAVATSEGNPEPSPLSILNVLRGPTHTEPRRRRYERYLRGHGRGQRRRADGHGEPDGDADEHQRSAHRRCGRRPDRHHAERGRDAERFGKRSGRSPVSAKIIMCDSLIFLMPFLIERT